MAAGEKMMCCSSREVEGGQSRWRSGRSGQVVAGPFQQTQWRSGPNVETETRRTRSLSAHARDKVSR